MSASQPLHVRGLLPPHVPPKLLAELDPAHGAVPDSGEEDERPGEA